MLEKASEFRDLARQGRALTDVVLLGMGGSSLCPDVLRNTFGSLKGHPKLHVLDTTDPATILSVRSKIRLQTSLFIVASKSGETTETLSHFAYFWEQTKGSGKQFAAITDRLELVTYEPGQIIFDEFERSDSVYIIRSGLVKLVKKTSALLSRDHIRSFPALAGYRGLMRNKTVVIPGWGNRLLALAPRLTPRDLVTRFVRRAQERVG